MYVRERSWADVSTHRDQIFADVEIQTFDGLIITVSHMFEA